MRVRNVHGPGFRTGGRKSGNEHKKAAKTHNWHYWRSQTTTIRLRTATAPSCSVRAHTLS